VPPTPTPPGERAENLDVLRGLALFGVLLENMQHFVSPSYDEWSFGPQGDGLDRAVFWGIRLLCDQKVYMLFALLLGTGVGLQLRRAHDTSEPFTPLHVWRMSILALIGLAHSLVWDGDILFTYALLGLLLLPFVHSSERVLRRLAIAALLLPAAALAASGSAAALSGAGPGFDATVGELSYPVRQSCFAFAMLALGLGLGRERRFAAPGSLLAAARPAFLPSLVLALAAHAVAVAVMARWRGSILSAPGLVFELALAVGASALVFVYVVAALRWLELPAWRARLRPIAAVGRATLSNYLLQSLIGVGILRHTGLGPLGPVTPPAGVALTVVIFALQAVASRWWLARFQFGPAEWVWRSATYGELLPLRRLSPPA